MSTDGQQQQKTGLRPARRQFLKAAGAGVAGVLGVGGGLALAGLSPLTAQAAGLGEPEGVVGTVDAMSCAESVPDMLNIALLVEHAAMTFYYAGLATRTVVPPATGQPANVECLQAALAQEASHAQILARYGAVSPHRTFHFPATAFQGLGYTSHFGRFLWVLDHLETALIGAYIAALRGCGAQGNRDLALLTARILAVECQHRELGRVVAGDYPVNNVTLEVNSFTCMSDALAVLQPYLTGKGFVEGSTPAIAIPEPAQIRWAVGEYAT